MVVKRPYQSARREQQARQTRHAILAAAAKLFVSPGYAATPLTAIAAEAGVAVQPVYAAFGSKRQLLSALVDMTIAGDDEPVALPDRPFVAAVRRAHRARQTRPLCPPPGQHPARRADVLIALHGAATADPDAAEIWRKNLDDRRRGMMIFATDLAATGEIPPASTKTTSPTCSGSRWTYATTTGSCASAAGHLGSISSGMPIPSPARSCATHRAAHSPPLSLNPPADPGRPSRLRFLHEEFPVRQDTAAGRRRPPQRTPSPAAAWIRRIAPSPAR